MKDIGLREFGRFLHSNGMVDLGFIGPGLLGIIIILVGLEFRRELIEFL